MPISCLSCGVRLAAESAAHDSGVIEQIRDQIFRPRSALHPSVVGLLLVRRALDLD